MTPTHLLAALARGLWHDRRPLVLPLGLSLLLAACGTPDGIPSEGPSGGPKGSLSLGLTGRGPGGYPVGAGDYQHDGPHANPPDLSRVADAVPRLEPLTPGANLPYENNGTQYVPDITGSAYRAQGQAAWYGRQFHGRPTANGEIYDMYAMTAAHPTLPIPSYARVSRADDGRQVVVRINDRSRRQDQHLIELSYAAAHRLDVLQANAAEVIVERIMPEDIAQTSPTMPAMVATPAEDTTSAAIRAWMPRAHQTSSASQPNSASPPNSVNAVTSVNSANPVSPISPAPKSYSREAYLQLGAFSSLSRAQTLAARLGSTLSEFGSVTVHQSGDQLYRVRLGPLEHSRARQLLNTVQQRSGIKPHITSP